VKGRVDFRYYPIAIKEDDDKEDDDEENDSKRG